MSLRRSGSFVNWRVMGVLVIRLQSDQVLRSGFLKQSKLYYRQQGQESYLSMSVPCTQNYCAMMPSKFNIGYRGLY